MFKRILVVLLALFNAGHLGAYKGGDRKCVFAEDKSWDEIPQRNRDLAEEFELVNGRIKVLGGSSTSSGNIKTVEKEMRQRGLLSAQVVVVAENPMGDLISHFIKETIVEDPNSLRRKHARRLERATAAAVQEESSKVAAVELTQTELDELQESASAAVSKNSAKLKAKARR